MRRNIHWVEITSHSHICWHSKKLKTITTYLRHFRTHTKSSGNSYLNSTFTWSHLKLLHVTLTISSNTTALNYARRKKYLFNKTYYSSLTKPKKNLQYTCNKNMKVKNTRLKLITVETSLRKNLTIAAWKMEGKETNFTSQKRSQTSNSFGKHGRFPQSLASSKGRNTSVGYGAITEYCYRLKNKQGIANNTMPSEAKQPTSAYNEIREHSRSEAKDKQNPVHQKPSDFKPKDGALFSDGRTSSVYP